MSTQHSGDPASYVDATRAADGGLTASDAAAQVTAGLKDSGVVLVDSISSKLTGAGTSALTITLAQNNDGVPDVWRAGLAAGAFAELTRTDEIAFSDFASSVKAVGLNSRGTLTTTQLGIGAVRLGQEFNSPSDDALTTRITNGAKAFGLEVGSIRIFHPLESAVEVTLVVPDNAEIGWTLNDLQAELIGKAPIVEGILIELQSEAGDPLARSGAAYRTGEGGVWFAPGQDARFGIVYGGGPW